MDVETLLPDELLLEFFNESVEFIHHLTKTGTRGINSMVRTLNVAHQGEISYCVAVLDEIPNDPDEKQKMFYDAGQKMQNEIPGNIMAVAFHSEGWMVDGPNKSGPLVPPSKDPRRIEVVIVTAESIDGRSLATMFQIRRSKDGRIELIAMENLEPRLSKPHQKEDTRMENALIGAFFDGVESTFGKPV